MTPIISLFNHKGRLDLAHPAVEKVTLVLEGIGGDKIRIDSTSLDQPLVILADQALEIVVIGKAGRGELRADGKVTVFQS
jgi:hypothetical protein